MQNPNKKNEPTFKERKIDNSFLVVAKHNQAIKTEGRLQSFTNSPKIKIRNLEPYFSL